MRLLSSLLLAAVISGLLSLATASADQPLSKEDITLLLLSSSPSSKIAQMIEQRGIDFQMDADLAKKFHDQGASDDLIDTLRKAGNKAAMAKVSAPAPVPSASSTVAGTSHTPAGPQPSLSGQPHESLFGSAAQQGPGTITPGATPSVTPGQLPRLPAMSRRRFAARRFTAAVAFSRDGRSLATVNYVVSRPDGPASPTPSVVVWDIQTGRMRQQLAGRADGVTSLAFHPNSRWLAGGNQDSTVKVWDTVAGNELHTLRGHAAAVDAVAFSPNGNLASVSIDGVLKLWDPATGRELQALPLGGPIQSATFSPDGSLLATRSLDPADTTIKLWDAAEGRQLRAIPAGAGSAMAFSPDRLLLSQADENAHAIRLFEVATGREVSRLDFNEPVIPLPPPGYPEQVQSLAFSPNGRWLAGLFGNLLHVHVWEVNSGHEALRLHAAGGRVHGVGEGGYAVAFSPDSQWLASTDGALFHVATPRELSGGRSELALFSGNAGNVSQLAFLGEGHMLALVGGGDLRLWDASTGQTIETVLSMGEGTRGLALSPDGHLLATAGLYAGALLRDSAVRLWDLKSAKELRTFTISTHGKWGPGTAPLAFSPDNHLLAVGDYNKIVLVDVDTGRELRTLVTSEDPTENVGMLLIAYYVESLAFSRDGRRLVAVANRSLQLWDSITGQRLADLPAPGFDALMKTLRSGIPPTGPAPPAQGQHSPDVTERQPQFFFSAALSPDGRWLAALKQKGGGGQGKQLVLYDAATLHEVRSLCDFSQDPADPALLSFSADGRELAAIGYQPGADAKRPMDTTLRVWDTSTGQLLRTLPLYHERGVGAAALSNDWQWLAAVPQQGEVGQMQAQSYSELSDRIANQQAEVAQMQMQTPVDVWEVSTGRPVHTLAGLPVRILRNNQPPLQAPGAAPDYPESLADMIFHGVNTRSPNGIAPQESSKASAAILRYQRALDLTPNDPQLHFALGAWFEARAVTAAGPPGPEDLPEAARKDFQSALEQYRLAHQLAPDNPSYTGAFERLRRLQIRP
jgi:WD40 repeat protein